MTKFAVFSNAFAGYNTFVNHKFKSTLLNLFDFAYRSRYSLPIIVSAACLVVGCKIRFDITFEIQEEEEEDTSEESSDDDSDQDQSVSSIISQHQLSLEQQQQLREAVRSHRPHCQATAV